jgi:hypothetical protein
VRITMLASHPTIPPMTSHNIVCMSVLLFAAQNRRAAVGRGYAPETRFVPGARPQDCKV